MGGKVLQRVLQVRCGTRGLKSTHPTLATAC
jgi:hypothetical protein